MGDNEGHSGKRTIDVSLRIKSHPVVLTPELAEQIVKEASYLCLGKKCVCRAERDCQDYPSDLGCLYLGEGARGIVTRGNAEEVTPEQALDIVRQARALGLVHMILWTSGELRALGADASRALELCSCCPCCCIERRLGDGRQAYIDGITGLGIARPDGGECVSCGDCTLSCAFNALTVDEYGPSINADLCKGCGRCETACRHGVLKVYPLEVIPSYADGWEMIPAEVYFGQIRRTVQ